MSAHMGRWLVLGLWLGGCGMLGHDAPVPVVQADGWQTYGAPVPDAPIVAAEALLSAPETFVGQTVVVSGRVADVCSKAGCWMVIAEGERTMRVRMKDHGFSVAKDGAGSDCRVAGEVVAVAVDPATVAHFEGESRKPGLMPEKSAQEGMVYEILASGVSLRPAG